MTAEDQIYFLAKILDFRVNGSTQLSIYNDVIPTQEGSSPDLKPFVVIRPKAIGLNCNRSLLAAKLSEYENYFRSSR
jgi:hypothetical protein